MHLHAGCMGQPATFKDFNKSYSHYKRERTSVIQVCRLTGQCVCYFCTCYVRDMHALIVMPRPLSISQETIIIALYCCVQFECPLSGN